MNTSITELNADVARISEQVATLTALLTGGTVKADKPAKTRKASGKRKARKTTNRKPVVNGTVEGHRCLIQKNREQFIADHDWAVAHTSTNDLARAVVAGAKLTGNWAIGPKTVARLTGVEEAVAQPITVQSQGGKPVKAKKAKKGKKSKAVVAEVVVQQSAKPISAARQAQLDAPRDALGRATPKREWALREALAESGQYDRFEIEAKVAEAYQTGLIAV